MPNLVKIGQKCRALYTKTYVRLVVAIDTNSLFKAFLCHAECFRIVDS